VRAWFQILLRSQPLVPAAILFVGGIVFARILEPGPVPLLAVMGGGLLVSRASRWVGRAVLLFSVGAVIYWARLAPFSENDLRVVLTDEPAIVTIRGELSETPQARDFTTVEFSTARLKVSEIQLNGSWQPARGEVMTRTRGILDEMFFGGRRVEVSGVIAPPNSAQAPGLFNYREYLKNNRIFFHFNVDSPADWNTLEEQPVPFLETIRRRAKWQLSRGLPEDEQLQMLWAMTLGWKTALSGEMAEPFMRTGTMHIFAISGLHVACIAGMLVIGMQTLGISRHQCAFVVVPLLWFYTIATGLQSSGVRSALMSTALIAGWSLKRPTALLNSTAAAALLILVFQPEQLFQAGFQLSFAVVVSIALLVPILEGRITEELPNDPFLPRELRRPWEKVLERCYFHARPNIIVSTACFIGAVPLTAYYFNLFTPISLVANLAAVPISSLALLFSMLSLVFFPLGEILNFFSWAFMWETISVARAFETVGGFYYVTKPGPAFFLFYFALVFSIFRGWLWRRGIRPWANSIILLLGVFWLASGRSNPSVHVLPSEGMPIWVDLPGTRNDLLIDCSNDRGFQFSVGRFLRAQGVGTIPNLLLTHGDVGHAGGFLRAMNEFTPGTIHTGPHSSRSPVYREAVRVLERVPKRWRTIARSDSVPGWNVLHPSAAEKFPRSDDNAVVLKTEINGIRLLLMGDLGSDGQRSLLNAGIDLSADVLVLGSPANGEKPRQSLLERISPSVVVLDKQKDLALDNAVVFNVGQVGAVTLAFAPGECRITSVSGKAETLFKTRR
jgi:competence protein ComEC